MTEDRDRVLGQGIVPDETSASGETSAAIQLAQAAPEPDPGANGQTLDSADDQPNPDLSQDELLQMAIEQGLVPADADPTDPATIAVLADMAEAIGRLGDGDAIEPAAGPDSPPPDPASGGGSGGFTPAESGSLTAEAEEGEEEELAEGPDGTPVPGAEAAGVDGTPAEPETFDLALFDDGDPDVPPPPAVTVGGTTPPPQPDTGGGDPAPGPGIPPTPPGPTNAPPTVSLIDDQAMNEDAGEGEVSLTIADAESAASDLTITATSSNPDLIGEADLSLGGSDGDRTLTFEPNPDQSGTATITVAVSDGEAVTETAFQIEVGAIADTPNVAAAEDSGEFDGPVPVGVLDVADPNGAITILGALESGVSDTDLYGFAIDQAASLVFDIDDTAPPEVDTIVSVFDAQGRLVGLGDDVDVQDEGSASILDAQIRGLELSPGAYTAAVSSFPTFPRAFADQPLSLDPLAEGFAVSDASPDTNFVDLLPDNGVEGGYRLQIRTAVDDIAPADEAMVGLNLGFSASVDDEDGSESLTELVLTPGIDVPEGSAFAADGPTPLDLGDEILFSEAAIFDGTEQIGAAATGSVTEVGADGGVTIAFDAADRVQSLESVDEILLAIPAGLFEDSDGAFGWSVTATATETDPGGPVTQAQAQAADEGLASLAGEDDAFAGNESDGDAGGRLALGSQAPAVPPVLVEPDSSSQSCC